MAEATVGDHRQIADERRAERLAAARQEKGGLRDDADHRRHDPGDGPESDGIAWLKANQNASGSWGSTYEFVDTCSVVETLATADPQSVELANGAVWLAGQTPPNYEYLARQIAALALVSGYESLAQTLTDDLLALRNPHQPNNTPNWPEGGWGFAAGYGTDCMTTAVGLYARTLVVLAGGVAVQNAAIAAGATNTHEFDIPADATKVRIRIDVFAATVHLRMKEGSPPGPFDPFFPLPPGAYLVVYPDSGLPFTTGHNFITLESSGAAGSYTMHVSYETPVWDTRTVWDPFNSMGAGFGPVEYLLQAQNIDGGWGLQRGGATEFYTSLHVLLALAKYAHYDLAVERNAGLDYLRLAQLAGGAFGYGGTPLPYVTALGALALVRSENYPFGTATEDAISALLTMQDVNGSWDDEPYDTALAVLALWDHNQPPTADAGPDQWVIDVNPPAGTEDVTLSGLGLDVDGTIQSYEWTENGVIIATGMSPVVTLALGRHIIVLTVTDNGGRIGTDGVTITVSGPPVTIYAADMGTDPGWTPEGLWAWGVPTGNGGNSGGFDPTSGFTGANVYGYNLTGGYEDNLPPTRLTTGPIDCSNYVGVGLKFRRWLCVEDSLYDHASIQVSTNPGDPNSWVTVYDHQGLTLVETSWSLQDIDIAALADGQSNVHVRWIMGPTDVTVNYGGWNIDDVEIYGGSIVAPGATIAGHAMTGLGGAPIPVVELTASNSGATTLTDGSGYYEFSLPIGVAETITPCKSGWLFNPGNRSYNPVTTSLTAEDYAGVLIYDVDPPGTGDDFVGVGDFSRFSTTWQQAVPANDPNDFDCDNFVGVGDLSFFVTAWLKSVFDSTIVFPGCRQCGGIPDPTPPTRLELRLVAVVEPTPVEQTKELPRTASAVPVGQRYFVEMWVRDLHDAGPGVTSAYADISVSGSAVDVRAASPSGNFAVFAGGSIEDWGVRDLGGSALAAGLGTQLWARIAEIEVVATGAERVHFDPLESGLGFAVYGRGRVPWAMIKAKGATVRQVRLRAMPPKD